MKKSQKGFTLVELIIVIAVIGVLAAILIPVFTSVIEKANSKSALSDARNTVEEITVESEDYLDMPEQIVIFVKKGGSIYVFGFDRASGGELQISNGNSHEFRGYTDISALNADYGNHTMFYLVPATDTTSGIRGIPMRDVQPGMNDYTDVLETYCASERIGRDNVVVYKGILESGTWYFEDHMQIPDTNSGNTTTSGNTGNNPPAPVATKTVTLTLNDSWNENSAQVQVEVPDAATCRWADIKAQDAITAGYWYCANNAETVTISGDTATVSNVTKMLTTSKANDKGNLTLSDYSAYTGTGAAFQGITTPAGFYKIDDTQAAMSGKYVQLSKIILESTYNTTDWCSGTNGKEDDSHKSDTIGGFGTGCGVFNGVYDGLGKGLDFFDSNLAGSTSCYVGLFAHLGTNAVVKDINMRQVHMISGAYFVGGITGYNEGQIIHCLISYATGKVYAYGITTEVPDTYSGSFAGGIAGINAGTIKCSQAITGRDISAEGHNDPDQPSQQLNASTGGIAGCNYNGALIDQCYFGGDLNGSIAGHTGGWCIGGIAGMNCKATISNCYAYNNFINCHAGSGGVVGVNDGGTLINCLSSTYSLWYHDFVCLGETAGMNAGGGTITNCYYDNANGAGAYMDYDSNCEGGGTGIDLYAATSISGFDSSIWEFPESACPELKNVPNYN